MVDLPKLPPELVISRDRNSQRVKRICAFVDMLQRKDPNHPAIEPLLKELNERLTGKHAERFKRRGAIIGVDKIVRVGR